MAREKQTRGTWKDIDGGYAFVIPDTLLRHEKMKTVSARCCKLLLDLGRQYSGRNNGYLCAAWEVMREFGWRSRETLALAIAEAVHHRLIQRTRQGGRHRPNLYALTWRSIDKRDGQPLDVATPTLQPSNAWKEPTSAYEIPRAIRDRRRKLKKDLHARRAA